MPSFLSKLFHRKKAGGPDEVSTSASKTSKKSRKSKKKEEKQHRDKKKGAVSDLKQKDGSTKTPLKELLKVGGGSTNNTNKGARPEADLLRQNSFTGTNTSTARDHSNYSGSAGKDVGGGGEPQSHHSSAVAVQNHAQARVLSPRNQVPNLVDSASSDSLPKNNQHHTSTTKNPLAWGAPGGPVDLDESDLDNASDTDENAIHRQPNDLMQQHNKMRSSSQRLSVQQLHRFDMQQQKREASASTQFYMPKEEPRFSAGHVPVDDMNRSDASSSSFNLSTDAEDTEYEALKRRGVVPAPLNTSQNTHNLDSSNVSVISTPTNYNTDGDNSIFPALQTDDEGTMVTLERDSQLGEILPAQQHSATTDDEQESRQIKIMSLSDKETDEDVRAWTVSPSKLSTNSKDHNGSSPSPSNLNSSSFPFSGASNNNRNDHSSSLSASGATSPTPRRNFTSPKVARSPSSFTSSGSHNPINSGGSRNENKGGGFADFADFSNVTFPADTEEWGATPRGANDGVKSKALVETTPKSPRSPGRSSSVSAAGDTETSLSDILSQAKGKRHSSGGGSRHSRSHHNHRMSNSSVNSAPAITAKYLRQHHNLKPRGSDAPRSPAAGDVTPVSDIIDSLEIANASRSTGKPHVPTQHPSSSDVMSSASRDASSSARAAKERLRERRRREREYGSSSAHRRSSRSGGAPEQESSDGSDQEASESWLFDEVTGALGPRGIAADLESLSGRSNRSKSSSGNKSHKSHRSHRSHRSSHRSSRRRKSHQKQSSGESVDSRGSRHSRNSKSSRYSHRSTRSYLSQMSEQSRSVANDLLRLEMQLAMVGSQEARDDGAVRSSASVGGASRASRKSRSSASTRRTVAVARRNKVTIMAPPGKLGIILANKADSKGTVVSGVRSSSVLSDKISPGDRIVAIDGEDVSLMTVSEITTIMARKSDFERTLTVLTTPKHLSMPGGGAEAKIGSPKRSAEYHHHDAYRYNRP